MVEYRVVKLTGRLIGWPNEEQAEKDLNELAQEGWEIATTLIAQGSTTAVIFEREKE